MPLADALALGDAAAPGVEVGQGLLDGLAQLGGGGAGQLGAGFPRAVDDGLQVVAHRRGWVWATMRWAASTHSSTGATSAMRMRPAPGLTPRTARASRLPGRTATLY